MEFNSLNISKLKISYKAAIVIYPTIEILWGLNGMTLITTLKGVKSICKNLRHTRKIYSAGLIALLLYWSRAHVLNFIYQRIFSSCR